MSGLYGVVTLILIYMLTSVITPAIDSQKKAWRFAHKHGRDKHPITSDAASSWLYVTAMAIAGGLSWFFFSRGLFESHWFAQTVGPEVAVYFIAVLLAGGLLFQALLEGRGKKFVTLSVIIVGVVPLLIGTVLLPASGFLSIWVYAISPVVMPVYGATGLLPNGGMPDATEQSMLLAFNFWLVIGLLVAAILSVKLRKHHRTLRQRAALPPSEPPAAGGDQ